MLEEYVLKNPTRFPLSSTATVLLMLSSLRMMLVSVLVSTMDSERTIAALYCRTAKLTPAAMPDESSATISTASSASAMD